MAIGWMTALKIIPWGDVLESAPRIVKAAKHLFSAANADSGTFAGPSNAPVGDGLANLGKRPRLTEPGTSEL